MNTVEAMNDAGFAFDVVDRSNLPIDLDSNGKYAALYEAAVKLDGGKTIVVRVNSGEQRDLSSLYAAVKYRIDKDERFTGLHIAQRNNKIFVFRNKNAGERE